MSPALGARPDGSATEFVVWSGRAERMWVSLFEERGSRETDRIELSRRDDGVFAAIVPGVGAGWRYGFRADGPYDPQNGLWFDPGKLLMDPYAVAIDRPYTYDARLAARRADGVDSAALMPKAVVTHLPELALQQPFFGPGGLVYELNVRSFTKLHPDVPEEQRGTIAALAHPAVIDHLTKLGVSAVELMPVTAWIDERHLGPLGLRNAWGYNPVSFMALDPRLAPGGIAELRDTVAALRAAGIGVILDVVFNHTGESDIFGPTLSLRGLDAQAYYRHALDGSLVNDTGCGHTLACDHPRVRDLILASLRHFVEQAGADGFRFDLAPVLGRTAEGFDARAATLRAIATDPVLADRVLIAEPWDIGPGGYQLGNFSGRWLEWNDRYRDDVRRYWRGDRGTVGSLATRLAGSSDVFGREGNATTRSVNFVAAHDGMTLADLTAYAHKHNEANGEDNRDGHDENFSWNHGVEGPSDDPAVLIRRRSDAEAMLTTLFLSRGTILLAAGDEFGRTQRGNNNAYAQDNAITWLDWAGRDLELERLVAALSSLRSRLGLDAQAFFAPAGGDEGPASAEWLWTDWTPMTEARWNDADNRHLALVVAQPGHPRAAALFNADRRAVAFVPKVRDGHAWREVTPAPVTRAEGAGAIRLEGRSVAILVEEAIDG
ncbi:glycogen debranching protein GlgX [Mesorhizobium sp. J428]|uniref:glycogen debranching protein GlgX n=1 Tax=Mesorhizobium sp. J428 TaxID=2898440 RepID=UPI002151ABE6|nr:glycogen debranching protein GlgX [Mesorhizobium sp. J428]MCR5858833.1 glycogen debranching protein GlgX [Mesorhizobium sp. J428]